MDEADIIIMIAEHLRLNAKDGEIVIEPAKLDRHLSLPDGSVAKHLDEALKMVSMKEVRRGDTSIVLRRFKKGTPWVSA